VDWGSKFLRSVLANQLTKHWCIRKTKYKFPTMWKSVICVRFHIVMTLTLKITLFGYDIVSSVMYVPILGRMPLPHEDAYSKCLPRVGCVFYQTVPRYVPKDGHIFVGCNLVMQWFCTVVIVKSSVVRVLWILLPSRSHEARGTFLFYFFPNFWPKPYIRL
jgi:hypothetical protein